MGFFFLNFLVLLPSKLFLKIQHILVTLCIIRHLSFNKIIQTAKMMCLQY